MSKDNAAHSAEGDKLIADDGGAAMMGEVKAAGVLTVVAGDTMGALRYCACLLLPTGGSGASVIG